MSYVKIYNYGNEIDYPINDKLKDYVNYILNVKGVKSRCEKMKFNFYIKTKTFKKSYMQYRKVKIIFYDKENKKIATIENEYYYLSGSCNYVLSYRHNDK